MAQKSNHATGRDARTGLSSEECAAEGCGNLSRGGGECMRHGATIKLWSSEGCTKNTATIKASEDMDKQ